MGKICANLSQDLGQKMGGGGGQKKLPKFTKKNTLSVRKQSLNL